MLWHRPYLLPQDVGRLTIAEIALCLEVPGPMGEDARRPPRGVTNMMAEPGLLEERIARWRQRTPLEKLEEIMRERRG